MPRLNATRDIRRINGPILPEQGGDQRILARLYHLRVYARTVTLTNLLPFGDFSCLLLCQEFQSMLGANQTSMDGTIKTGKVLMDKSPQDDSIMIEGKIADLKARWDAICALSVERLVIA